MKEIQVFNFEQNEVRTLQVNNQPYFVLADVCKVLEIKNSRDTVNRLDSDEKGVGLIYTPGGKQKMTIINESGLYAVILRSDKPQAKQFRKWITAEVLPTLRKTGTYSVKKSEEDKARMLATREENVKVRKAQLLYKVSEKCGVESYKQVAQPHNAHAHRSRTVAASQSRTYDLYGRANRRHVGYLGEYGRQARQSPRIEDGGIRRDCVG